MPRQNAGQNSVKGKKKPKITGQARKPYRSPSLVVYGDLQRLTLAKGGKKSEVGPKTKLGTE